MTLTTGTIGYVSTIDLDLTLQAKIAYPTGGTLLPIVVLMHSWYASSTAFDGGALDRFANYGVFAVVPDMRGRGSSQGNEDAGGREIQDIIDAVEYVKANYAANVDSSQIGIVGYSGGGGNTYSAISRFPDYFNTAAVFFGMSDYGHNPADGWYQTTPLYRTEMDAWIGGSPTTYPDRYHARASVLAVQNYTGGYLWIFHDDQDPYVPVSHTDNAVSALSTAGLTNYSASITTTTDSPRWIHALQNTGEPIVNAESTFIAPIVAKTHGAWTVPASGTMKVMGWLDTKRFALWLGDGTEEFGSVTYNTTTRVFTHSADTGAYTWALTLKSQTPNASITATINGGNHRSTADSSGSVTFSSSTEITMAASDARPIPRKNVAFRVTFPIFDADGDLVAGASGLDSEVSIDAGTFADCTNEAIEIATSSGMYYLDLTSGEMNGDTITVIVKTSTSGAKTVPITLYPEELGDLRVDVGQISGDATAADNAESFFDGTGYAGTGNTIPTVTASGLADGAITAAKIANDAITAAKVADGTIDAATFATAALQAIADAVLGRSVSNIDNTAATHSLYELIQAILESSTATGSWLIYKTNGSTVFNTRTLDTDAEAVPIVGVS
jgi:dienelactone hydrolase